jgi:ABC-type Zn uptake system ZnuABC Zn-binding protein ZnuA
VEIIQLVRSARIKAIIVEPFYDLSAPQQIERSTGAKVLVLPTSVGGGGSATDYISMIEYDIKSVMAALQ